MKNEIPLAVRSGCGPEPIIWGKTNRHWLNYKKQNSAHVPSTFSDHEAAPVFDYVLRLQW